MSRATIASGDGWPRDVGIYEFTMGAAGDAVKARYTHVYGFEDNQWKISRHHSSVMPEGIDIATPITENEVRGRRPFVYVCEDGQWKIAHHHLFMIPKLLLATPGNHRQ